MVLEMTCFFIFLSWVWSHTIKYYHIVASHLKLKSYVTHSHDVSCCGYVWYNILWRPAITRLRESFDLVSPVWDEHDISYIIYYAREKDILYIILWRAAITREMTQRVVWSRLLCVGRTRSPPFFLFTSLPPKKVEGGSFFSHYEQVPMCVGSRTLGTRCWADWISYKIRICIPKPGVIVWKRVTWQPVPTLLDPRPPPQTAVPMPSHMAPWAPQGWPSPPHPTPTWHNYGLLFRSRSSAPALVEGFKRSHSDRSPHTRPTSACQAWR